jgi:hypothetical protein
MYEVTATGFLDIENPCNTCICATNDLFQEYVLIIQTQYGKTKVLNYGPNIVDIEKPSTNVSCYYSEFDVSNYKIDNIIDKFLSKSCATQAIEITLEEAKDKIRDMRCFIDDNEGEG